MRESWAKLFMGILLAGMLSGNAQARGVAVIPYPQRIDQSDLVVIATPISTQDTSERTSLLMDSPAIGAETIFKIDAVLKGEKITLLTLHHYHADPTQSQPINAAFGCGFDPKIARDYLLFLKKETGSAYYVPFSGQDDPYVNSIVKLDNFGP